MEIKIVDEANNVVPVGEKGEVCTTGLFGYAGYWNDPEHGRDDRRGRLAAFRRLATMDEEGYVRIVGRIKDMIIRGAKTSTHARLRSSCTSIPPFQRFRYLASR